MGRGRVCDGISYANGAFEVVPPPRFAHVLPVFERIEHCQYCTALRHQRVTIFAMHIRVFISRNHCLSNENKSLQRRSQCDLRKWHIRQNLHSNWQHCDHKWQHCGHKWWVTCAVCEDEEQDKVGPGSSIVQVSTGRCVQIA